MRSMLLRVALAAATVTAVVACDSAVTPIKPGGTSGSGGGGGTPTDSTRPTVRIDTLIPLSQANIGDSIYVVAYASGPRPLKTLEFVGYRETGDSALGTLTRTIRYSKITAAVNGTPVRVRRYLKPVLPVDTTQDTLRVWVIATDSAGRADTAFAKIAIVSGPTISIVAPQSNNKFQPGGLVQIDAIASQKDVGLDSMFVRIQSQGTGWAAPVDVTVPISSGGAYFDTLSTTYQIPANAPNASLFITATAKDRNGKVAQAFVSVAVCATCVPAPPHVQQQVPALMEVDDSVTVSADAARGIAEVGVLIRDSTDVIGTQQTISVLVPRVNGTYPSNATVRLPILPSSLTLAQRLAMQGKRLYVRSYARDSVGATGYSVPLGSTTVDTSLTLATKDTVRLAYGRSFSPPRNGILADIAVDEKYGNVYLSNTQKNLLEVWNNGSEGYHSTGVPVGSLPWGMFVGASGDTLLVANSGATTISRVFIGSSAFGSLHEDLAHRVRTRNTYVYTVQYIKDNTGKIRLIVKGPYGYSDRPEYVAEAGSGRLYYSTRPTETAKEGTIRWLDPTHVYADPRQVHSYAKQITGEDIIWAVFNADSVAVRAHTSAAVDDSLMIFDHTPDTNAVSVMAIDPEPLVTLQKLQAMIPTDVEMIYQLDITTLGLTDTTFLAASRNRSWIAFGEGNTTGTTPGRIMMVKDSSRSVAPFFSPLVTISDVLENASEKVFGIAVDSIGRQVGAHGLQSYQLALDDPFHLRLEGFYDSIDKGVGVAFHPGAYGPNTPKDARMMFVAGQLAELDASRVEIVDAAYYFNRGTLPVKGLLYGPLRASRYVTPAEAGAGVILKLYGLTENGLVVIPLTAADIKDAP